MKKLFHKISLWSMVIFYTLAGINHFLDPGFYYQLIPDYLPAPKLINYLSGIVEIMVGIGFIFQSTRRLSFYITLLMLIAFIPSHVYLINVGGCINDSICVPLWVAWLRLVLVHPLLMIWVWNHRK